ncbi:MAG: response regulator [Burkholderiales bacterium]|nr:response regulator [Burkholderiales bacterium]
MKAPTVLIVDDEPINLVLLESLLEDHYRVLVACSGDEALTHLHHAKNDVALVISDVMMPHMDGHELCRLIRSDSSSAHVPVILISSLDQEADQVAGLLAGASELVVKPYSPELLLHRVRQQIRWRRMEQILKEHGLSIPD